MSALVDVRVGVLVGLITAGLSLVASWSVSLWSDEVATISASTRSLGDLWRLVGEIDAVHGTYYAAMHAWTELFGSSPFSVRLPSALAVGLAAGGVYVVATWLADSRTALLAAGVFAILPRVTWAGMEARPFPWTIACAVWLTVVLLLVVRGRSRRTALACYGVLLAVGIALNLYVALLAASHAVTLVSRRSTRRILGPFVIAAACGALLVAPIVLAGLSQGGQLGSRERTPLTLIRNVVVNQWFLGDTPTGTTSSGTLAGALQPAGLWKIAAVALAVLCWLLVGRLLLAARRGHDRVSRDLAVWAAPWLVVPTLLLVVYSMASPAAYNARYFAFSAPAVALLVAGGMRFGAPRQAAVIGVLIVALVLPVYASQRTVTAKSGSDLLLVADLLEERAAPGDGIYYGPRDDLTGGQARRSLRTVGLGYPEAVDGLRDVTLMESPADGATLFGTSAALDDSLTQLRGIDTLWVVRRQDRPTDAQREDRLLNAAGFRLVDQFDGPQTEVLELIRE